MTRDLSKEAAERRVIKSVWGHQLVTVNKADDGGEEYWDLRNRVTPHSIGRERNLQAEWIACQWPVMSEWRSGSCSRMVPQRSDGCLSLCWQHLDACFSDVLSRLQGGEINRTQVERLVRAVLDSNDFQPNGSPRWHPDIETFIEEQIDNYLLSMLREDDEHIYKTWMHRRPRQQIEERINELIEKRLQQKWGVNS